MGMDQIVHIPASGVCQRSAALTCFAVEREETNYQNTSTIQQTAHETPQEMVNGLKDRLLAQSAGCFDAVIKRIQFNPKFGQVRFCDDDRDVFVDE